jgi:hypothetical protein
MTTRTDERRKRRRRQHLETTRGADTASVDRDSVPAPELLEARHATVRVAVAIACLLGAQFLHWSVIDQHAREWTAAGNFFFVLAFVEGVMTVLVIARLRPWVAAAGIAVSVVPVVIWAWDRTLGLPFGPTKGIRGTIGRSDVLSVVFEVLTIVALWPFLRPRYGASRPVRLDVVGKAVIGITVVYVAGFSYWAMLGDQGAIHGAHAATTTAAAIVQPGPTTTVVSTTSSPAGLVPIQTLSYIGKEYSFDGPTTVAAGVTRIDLQDLGVEAHDLQVARIPDSTPTPSNLANLEDLFAEAQSATEGAPKIIADTLSAEPGATSTTIVELTPGRYLLACANAAADGTYHYAQGMISVLTVTAPAGAQPVTTDSVVLVPEG